MKILLLNDNPVVRKLVALSAQKTKDDLSVIWSVDEVEGSEYDLLIVDDAHYSDESMAALKEKIQFKTSLLMATRGNATPAGFDKVINKPFLPTDLVDLFAQIDKDLAPSAQAVREERNVEEGNAIVLDDTIEEDSAHEEGFDITNLDDELDLDDFDIEDDSEMAVKTNVLDHEEVQELQDLLDDTDNFDMDDELSLEGLIEESKISDDTLSENKINDEDLLDSLDDDIFQALESESPSPSTESELDSMMEEFDFDEELISHEEESATPMEENSEDEDLLGSLDDLSAVDEEEFEETAKDAPIAEEESEDMDTLLPDELEGFDEEDALLSLESMDDALSDDELGELEQQIQEAVEELGIEDLAQGIDEVEIGDLSSFNGLDDLDGLSERAIKLAIGETVEEEPEVSIGHGSHASLDAEALSEAMEESSVVELDDDLENIDLEEPMSTSVEEHHGTTAEGMDALQALLKALSNEEVAKTLKGLSINININFGNEK